ncbi:MAG: hypothetical protein DHS20C07_08020 [Methyloligella sp.]|nr:MAG: hypothetical protein DHS20C07_08020 [Methyloligella sp.]
MLNYIASQMPIEEKTKKLNFNNKNQRLKDSSLWLSIKHSPNSGFLSLNDPPKMKHSL